MSTIQIIVHRELNSVTCTCGYTGLNHECKFKIKEGILSIKKCSNDCKLCEQELEKQEYHSRRWQTNNDGYIVCGICEEKICGTSNVCTDCFCSNCYEERDFGDDYDDDDNFCSNCKHEKENVGN